MALLFALTTIPVLGFVALAVDVGSAVWAREQLDIAADAAALTAVTTAANAFAQNPNTSFTPSQEAGEKRFYAQANQMPNVVLTSLSVTVARSGGTISAVATYAATYKTNFAGLFGVPTLPATGRATASRTNSPFFDITIMMDDSSSMAIGASQADMTKLGQLVHASSMYTSWGQSQNCAFGCHFASNNNDFYGMAQANNVQLRINVLSTAVQNVIQTVSQSVSAGQFMVGLYSFNTTFNTVYANSPNLSGAQAAAKAMTVPLTTSGSDADTNLPLALQSITNALPAAGDGSTVDQPLRYLFIVTDGVADYYNAKGARVLGPLDPTECAGLKAKGIQVLTLYTQYIPLIPPYVPQSNAYYVANVAPFVNQIAPNLQACASSASFAFQATDATSINTALQAMLQAALSQPARFTQ